MKLCDEEFPKFYSSMYYMRAISESYGTTYTGRKPSNKYLKDWYTSLTGHEAPSTHKFNLWYLRRIAEYVSSDELPEDLNENQCVHIIADNIDISTTVKLTAVPSVQTLNEDVVLTATVLDESKQPISGGTVTFKDGTTTINTATTGSDGKASITVSTLSAGEHTIYAEYDEYRGSAKVTINKLTPTLTITSGSSTYYVGQTISIEGELSVGSGETVKLYDGNTLIDDNITTITDGVFSTTISNATVGVHNYNVRYDGNASYSSITSNVEPVTVQAKIGTVLTIDTPTIIYSDDFDVTGTLTESDGITPISSALITLSWNDGSDHTTTAYTGSDGKVTFTTSEPTAITQYTFQLIYSGSESHNNATSSTISVTTQKETSVLNITAPSDSATVSGSTFTVTGTLKDNDDEVMANKSVKVKLGSSILATLTTDSSGVISDTVSTTGLSDGSNTIRIIFEEDTYYTESYTDKTITFTDNFDDMSLTASAGKTDGILSYADYSAQSNTEYVTVTAQLENNGTSATISGVPIEFGVYDLNDDSLIGTTTTENTNASGQATYTYTSQGIGDVYIKAVPDNRSLLSETYSVYDYLQVPTLNGDNIYQISGTTTVSNGEMGGGSAYLSLGFDNTGDWELTCKVKFSGSNCCLAVFPHGETSRDNNELGVQGYNTTTFWNVNGTYNRLYDNGRHLSYNTYYTLVIKKENGAITTLIDGVSRSPSWSPSTSELHIGVGGWGTSGNTCTIKDIVVKPL